MVVGCLCTRGVIHIVWESRESTQRCAKRYRDDLSCVVLLGTVQCLCAAWAQVAYPTQTLPGCRCVCVENPVTFFHDGNTRTAQHHRLKAAFRHPTYPQRLCNNTKPIQPPTFWHLMYLSRRCNNIKPIQPPIIRHPTYLERATCCKGGFPTTTTTIAMHCDNMAKRHFCKSKEFCPRFWSLLTGPGVASHLGWCWPFFPLTFVEFSIDAIASRSQSSQNQWNLSLPAFTVTSSGLMSAHVLQMHFWQPFVSSSSSFKFRSRELQNPNV